MPTAPTPRPQEAQGPRAKCPAHQMRLPLRLEADAEVRTDVFVSGCSGVGSATNKNDCAGGTVTREGHCSEVPSAKVQ